MWLLDNISLLVDFYDLQKIDHNHRIEGIFLNISIEISYLTSLLSLGTIGRAGVTFTSIILYWCSV